MTIAVAQNPTDAIAAQTALHARILAHPAGEWTVINKRGGSGDVGFHVTTLLTKIDGQEIRISKSVCDTGAGSGTRPDQIGASGSHPWDTAHPLFDQVASKIRTNLSAELKHAAANLSELVRLSDAVMWESGPRKEYLQGQFLFAGYRASYMQEATWRGETAESCQEGYLGRIVTSAGTVSVLARKMDGEKFRAAVSMSKGDFHQTLELTPDAARQLFSEIKSQFGKQE